MILLISDEKIHVDNLEQLIKQHIAFIIRTVSNLTGRYVSIENDDEFSIALCAFAESVERYDKGRGSFLSFAGLVIESRVKTFLEQKNKIKNEISLEELISAGHDIPDPCSEHQNEWDDLPQEISLFSKELELFGLTFESLADDAPKHKDTRNTAIKAAEKASENTLIVDRAYQKRRLPVREVALLNNLTEKIVKRSKWFILSVMIIFVKRFTNLIYWIKGSRCFHV